MQRRSFLKSSLASTASLALAQPLVTMARMAPDTPYLRTIGLQLWTVRNQLDKDVPGTIKAVADAGYYQVEMGRVLGSEPVVAAAKENGLKITSSFIDWQSIGNPDGENVPPFQDILDTAIALDLKYLLFGYIGKGHRETPDHFKRHAERANAAGDKCRDAGIQLCYHNHSFEFEELSGGKRGWDIFVDEFDKDLVKFELDVFWAQIGGDDPVRLIHDLKGRIAQLHLKDLQAGTDIIYDEGKVPHDAFQELGDGVVDMTAVLEAGAETGVDQCHVEQDQSPDPIASISQSMKWLRTV